MHNPMSFSWCQQPQFNISKKLDSYLSPAFRNGVNREQNTTENNDAKPEYTNWKFS